VLLRTVLWSWELGSEVAAKDRVVTRHKITFIMTLPRRYVSDLEQHAAELGVKQTTFAVWFGGKDPAHEHDSSAASPSTPKRTSTSTARFRSRPCKSKRAVQDR